MLGVEQKTERREIESLIGKPAIIIPELILASNPNIASIQMKIDHQSFIYRKDKPILFNETGNVVMTNKIVTTDGKKAWLLFVNYRNWMSEKNVETAKQKAITIPTGWGFFIGNNESLNFIGCVPVIKEDHLFALIGRTLEDRQVNPYWMAQQIVEKRKDIILQRTNRQTSPKIVGTIGI